MQFISHVFGVPVVLFRERLRRIREDLHFPLPILFLLLALVMPMSTRNIAMILALICLEEVLRAFWIATMPDAFAPFF